MAVRHNYKMLLCAADITLVNTIRASALKRINKKNYNKPRNILVVKVKVKFNFYKEK